VREECVCNEDVAFEFGDAREREGLYVVERVLPRCVEVQDCAIVDGAVVTRFWVAGVGGYDDCRVLWAERKPLVKR
jgi:hypothetical protein